MSSAAAFPQEPNCGYDYELQREAAFERLVSLAVVKEAHCDPKRNRVIASVWCVSTHGTSALKQPLVALNKKNVDDPSAVPTYLVAIEKLIEKIELTHGADCIAFAEQAKAAAAATDEPSGARTDVLRAMMKLKALRTRADVANEAVLAIEKERDQAEVDYAELAAELQPPAKRPCDGTAGDQVAPHEPRTSWQDWHLSTFRREEGHAVRRRAVPLQADVALTERRRGGEGYLRHSRRGLVGAVQDWARGSMAAAAMMIVALMAALGIVDLVRTAMPKTEAEREVETDTMIVDLLEQGLAETKHCRNEMQRQQHGIGLALVSPPRDTGFVERIARRLKQHWGTRAKKAGETKGRGHPFDQSIDRRAAFNAAVDGPSPGPCLAPGDAVLSDGDPAVLKRILGDYGGPCILAFPAGDGLDGLSAEEKQFDRMFGPGAGSARLRRAVPTLAPPPRAARRDGISADVRNLVREHAEETCPQSPCKRDWVRKHVSKHGWAGRQARILMMPIYMLYASFEAEHPGRLKETA